MMCIFKIQNQNHKLKSLVLVLFILSLSTIVIAQTNYYSIKKDTYSLNRYRNPYYRLFPGEKLYTNYSDYYWNDVLYDRGFEGVYLRYEQDIEDKNISGNELYSYSSDMEIIGSSPLPKEIYTITSPHDNSQLWIPAYYKEILLSKDRLNIFDYYPHLKGTNDIDEIINTFFTTMVYFNDVYVLFVDPSAHTLLFPVINFSKIDDKAYVIYTQALVKDVQFRYSIRPESDFPLKYEKIISGYKNILYIYKLDDRLLIFTDLNEEPVFTLVKVHNTLFKNIEKMINSRNTKINEKILNSVLFKDFEDIDLSKIKKQFQINRPDEETYTVIKKADIQSIPFNSSEYKIGEVHVDQKLYLLESGCYASLDDIYAPWLHIETESGVRGWVWGGFLEELNPYVFPATHKVLDTLRLRRNATTSSVAIAMLHTDDLIILLETGQTVTIDGITAPWVKVENQKGQVGWCFSGYLESLEKKSDVNETGTDVSSDAQKNKAEGFPVLLIVIIAAGALLLGAIIFILIRKKK